MSNNILTIPTREEIKGKVQSSISELLNIDLSDKDLIEKMKQSVESFGAGIQKEAFLNNDLAKKPISQLQNKSEDGEKVANALMGLKDQIDILDPSRVNFKKDGLLAKIFNPTKKYFKKYESSQTIINGIMTTLDEGSDLLKRDNIFLVNSSKKLGATIDKLENALEFVKELDVQLTEKALDCDSEERQTFLEKDILFAVRQRVLDLQQQLLLSQQGVVTTEMIANNNKELIKGCVRAKNVTVVALHQAIMVAETLTNQELILNQITALNTTTSNMILHTSKMLGTQGVKINNQASDVMLDTKILKESFVELRKAVNSTLEFKENALPKMAEAIIELDELAITGRQSLERLECTNIVDVQLSQISE